MRLNIGVALGFGALLAAGLSAQEPRLDKPSSTIIVTGCLQHTDPAAIVGAAPRPGFVLTEATLVAPPAPASGAVPTPVGTSGTKAETYALEGSDVELALHAARLVEITGSVVIPPESDDRPDALQHAQPEMKRLHVASIKEMAMDCAPKS